MTINTTKSALPKSEYFQEEYPKDLIVLHFTAGSTADGAHQEWVRSPAQVGTAYIVDVDGTVYQTFDPKHWAYHLGMKTGNPGHKHDKRSIGIEIVNVGPLKWCLGRWCWWPNNFHKPYIGPLKEVTYRGFRAYADFRAEQYVSVASLLDKLCAEFKIPRIAPADWLGCDLKARATFSGVANHGNFRLDKCDIGPAFDRGRVGL
jgi:N-acetyl-anhydromuramyl-L-alanine amidase AmpD